MKPFAAPLLLIFMINTVTAFGTPNAVPSNLNADQLALIERCEDPTPRERMSVLETAFFGPAYSSYEYDSAKDSYSEKIYRSLQENRPALVPIQTEEEFFQVLKLQVLFSMGENLVRNYGFLNEKKNLGLLSPFVKLKGTAFTNRIAGVICGVGCSGKTREEIAQHLAIYYEKLKANGYREITLADVASDLDTERLALVSILKAHGVSEEQRLNDYHAHLSAQTILGFGQMFFTAELDTPIRRQGVCDKSWKCAREWQAMRLTEDSTRFALISHFGQIQVTASSLNHSKFSEDNISKFYRYAPDTVVRAYSSQPGAMAFHCKYLAKSLGDIGEQMAFSETGNGISYLAPMTAFWLLGTGVGALKGGNFGVAKTLTAVAALTVIDLLWRTHQLRNQENASSKILMWNLNDYEVPREQLNQYLLIRDSIAQDRDTISGIVMYEGISLIVGGLVGRALAFGSKNVFKTFNDIPSLFRRLQIERKTFPKLHALRIHTEDDFLRWIKTSPKGEVKKLMNVLEKESAGTQLIGMKVLIDSFYIYPEQIRPAAGSLKERIAY